MVCKLGLIADMNALIKHSTILFALIKADLGPDYQNACKVTMFSTLYLELQHKRYNVPAML